MGKRKFRWSDETVLEAIDRFRALNGTEPTSHDFQFTDYLPDPQTIRRLYGGLPLFRKKFGFDVEDYTKGTARSEISRNLNDRGKSHEDSIQALLISHFGEICVHKEKEFSYRNRVDFQVYHENGVFGVDTFYPYNRATLVNIFNLKHAKYKNFERGPVYLVCMNSELSQKDLDSYIEKRKDPTAPNVYLLSEEVFLIEIQKYKKRVKI